MRNFSFICLILIHFSSVFAQIEDISDSYELFRNKAITNYNSFRAKANHEYAEWMKRAWEQYRALPIIRQPKDKDTPPIFYNRDEAIKGRAINADIHPLPRIAPQPLPIQPIKENPNPHTTHCRFDFYGLECCIRFDGNQPLDLSSISNENIASQWNMLANGALDNTIRDCIEFRISHNLCDWAFIQFLDKFAKSAVKGKSESNLLTAFLLCQIGYKIRLAKSDDTLYFLYASPHHLYDIPTFIIDNTYFYGYNCHDTHLDVFNYNFPNEQIISFWIPHEQEFGIKASTKREILSKRFPDMRITVNVNENIIDFFESYPKSYIDNNFMTRWAMYANTPLSQNIKDSVYPQLYNCIRGLGQLDAANKLLNLVQTGFTYEFDDKIWGHDRAFFAEETLFYPYCDCEDRSILYSRLVRDLLGLEVLLVYYPGHLATAVRFTDRVEGDYILYDNKPFVIADPTYIGAPIGATMPEMENKTAKVILLSQ
ncbi:MAG: hypothetical protein E7082_00885 [Bacteroidales bacterium]|nr:hypothetical protein [Bacteroidales bacterium]